MTSLLGRLRSLMRGRTQGTARVAVFDVSMGTDNLGDFIIMRYCMRILNECFPRADFFHVPTHRPPTEKELDAVEQADARVVCGTNIICPNMERYSLWKLPEDTTAYKDILAMGVGMNSYGDMTQTSIDFFKRAFVGPVPVSVRDGYTARTLSEAGFSQVTNTNCVTMWGLTADALAQVPSLPQRDVVFTLTAHRRNVECDLAFVRALDVCYEHLYFWPQGDKDLGYLQELCAMGPTVRVLPRTLESFDELLARGGVDYAGTRLHGGINALNAGVRTFVIPVDNRAIEIQRDTGLAALERGGSVEDMVARLKAPYHANLCINWEEIGAWKDAVMHYASCIGRQSV